MRDANSSSADERAKSEPSPAEEIPESGEPGSIHVIVGSRKVRVVLTGEVDANLGPELLESVADIEDLGLPVEVAAHQVTFMDSTGVGFLARLAARTRPKLVLIRPPEIVRFLLSVTKIADVIDVHDDDPGIDTTLPRH